MTLIIDYIGLEATGGFAYSIVVCIGYLSVRAVQGLVWWVHR